MIQKILKSRIFTFLLGLVIAGSAGAIYAASVASSDVSYSNSSSGSSATTVKAALDDLYTKVGNGATVKTGTFSTSSSAAVTVTVGFKPRILFVYWVKSDRSNAAVAFYNSEDSLFGSYQYVMHVQHNNSDSTGTSTRLSLPNTTGQRIDQITDTGFVYGKVSGSAQTYYYVAIK